MPPKAKRKTAGNNSSSGDGAVPELTDATSAVTDHRWAGGVISFACMRNLNGKSSRHTIVVDAQALGLKATGLLHEALLDVPSPAHLSTIRQFKAAIPVVCRAPDIVDILNTPAKELSIDQLEQVFRRFDKAAARSNRASPYEFAKTASRVIRWCEAFLRTGEQVSSVKFNSELSKGQPRDKRNLSSHYDSTQTTELLRQPLQTMDIADPVARKQATLEHLLARRKGLVNACAQAIATHQELVRGLERVYAEGLPITLPTVMRNHLARGGKTSYGGLRKRTPSERWSIAVYIVHRDSMWKGFSKAFKAPLSEVPEVIASTFPLSSLEVRATLLGQFFAPRTVVMATLILLLVETGWNTHTALKLTAEDIIDEDATIRLCAPKTRSGELQPAEISKLDSDSDSDKGDIQPEDQNIDSPVLIQALRILLKQRSNIDKFGSSESPSIFCIFDVTQNGKPKFDIPVISTLTRIFTRRFGLPAYRLEEIRAQYAAILYLESNNNIFLVQARLGHGDATTTVDYLRLKLFEQLGESRMVQFMSLLRGCILFSCGRKDQLTKKEIAAVERNQLLLFSASSDVDDFCIADDWFENPRKFTVTDEEIAHCALQKRFYKDNLTQLLTSNPIRFKRVHFWRIVFCEALYRVIASSEFSGTLTEFEKTP